MYTPDSLQRKLVKLLQHAINQIQRFGAMFAGSADCTLLERNIAEYCGVVLALAMRMRGHIGAFVLVIMPVLTNCLGLQVVMVYEEAMLAVGAVMEYSGPDGVPYISHAVRSILHSQMSHSPSMTSFGALCAMNLYRGHGRLMDEVTHEILDAFRRNLNDDLVPLETKVTLLKAIAVVIELSGVGTNFWEFFFETLVGFGALPLTGATEREAGPALMVALAKGYRTLVVIAREDQLVRFFQKFKLIVDLIGRIEKWGWCDLEVVTAMTELLMAVIRCPVELQKSINALLHRNCVKELLTRGRHDFHILQAHTVEQHLLGL
jgi:hypothetical protein